MDWMGDCRQLVSEASHIQTPQTQKSFAQPLRSDQIDSMVETALERSLVIGVVSHHQNRTVRQLMGESVEKTFGEDEIDCRSWHRFISLGRISMHRLRKIGSGQDRSAIYEFKDRTNQILNAARMFKYRMSPAVFDELGYEVGSDICLRLLESENLLYEKGKDVAACRHGIAYRHPKGVRLAIYALKNSQLYSLAALMFDPFTSARRVRIDTGEPPGVRWLMRHIVGNTPFHHRGGIARSNIYHHGIKNFSGIGSQSKKKWSDITPKEEEAIRDRRRDYVKAVRAVLQALKAAADGKQRNRMFGFRL